MRAVTVCAVLAVACMVFVASVNAQPRPLTGVRPSRVATKAAPAKTNGARKVEVSPASGSKSGPVAAQCNRQALLLAPANMQSALSASCVKRRKQSKAYCGALAGRKMAALRKAIVMRCEAKHPKQPNANANAKSNGKSNGKKSLIELKAQGDEDPRLHPTGMIGKIADFLVQKASGTTATEISAGCDFQRKMNCRAWITDCADSCMGESMSTCQSCMGGHFSECCNCDTVRQFGISSCSY